MKPPKAAIAALLNGTHADPFSLLGGHAGPGGTHARVILPGADKAQAFSLGGEALGADGQESQPGILARGCAVGFQLCGF